eukprot:410572_1
MNEKCLYKMIKYMSKTKNKDVICCTGRARIYSFEDEYKYKKLFGTIKRKSVINVENNADENGQLQIGEKHNEKQISWWENEIFFENDDDKKCDIMENDYTMKTVYNLDTEDSDFDHRCSMNAHLRECQMFEFEALYGTIGCYLLGGFLPVIPGPCGFYRARNYLLNDEIRNWYFDQINKKNDPENMNLILGNMKLAEDRILTITSIFNYDGSVRHAIIPECIFYFDPQPTLISLMKQRRRWINGSIATIIYVLRKVSFTRWKVNYFRRLYVLSIWYMQLMMFIVLFLSPPIIFIVSFQDGLATILDVVMDDGEDRKKHMQIYIYVSLFMVISWIIYLAFIYVAQTKDTKTVCGFKIKPIIIQAMLYVSFTFGICTMTGLAMQFTVLINYFIYPNADFHKSFAWFVTTIGIIFFVQSFVLAPLFSKDSTTLRILLKTFCTYFLYAPFYVILIFIHA